ncbi:hypothetical protein BGW80DRAFT_1445435 [Lactifluus volemus]|nr:hypothetical protein BGW80DRAFT_1445435 [Lactifluus volemus]
MAVKRRCGWRKKKNSGERTTEEWGVLSQMRGLRDNVVWRRAGGVEIENLNVGYGQNYPRVIRAGLKPGNGNLAYSKLEGFGRAQSVFDTVAQNLRETVLIIRAEKSRREHASCVQHNERIASSRTRRILMNGTSLWVVEDEKVNGKRKGEREYLARISNEKMLAPMPRRTVQRTKSSSAWCQSPRKFASIWWWGCKDSTEIVGRCWWSAIPSILECGLEGAIGGFTGPGLSSTSCLGEVRVYLRDLASAANGSTNENSCGSVLADQASDADEFGDISVCLGTGQYGEGRELDILLALNSTPRAAQQVFLPAHEQQLGEFRCIPSSGRREFVSGVALVGIGVTLE